MNMTDLKFAALAAIMAVAVTGATLVAASPAFAADVVVNAPTARVSYADLDLGSRAGVAKLQKRVAAAAGRLCIGIGMETLAARMEDSKCEQATIAAAAPQVRRAIQRFAQASSGRAITLTLR